MSLSPYLQGQGGGYLLRAQVLCQGHGAGGERGGSLLSIFYVETLFIHRVFKLHSDPMRQCFIFPICQNWQLRLREVKQLAQGHTARQR